MRKDDRLKKNKFETGAFATGLNNKKMNPVSGRMNFSGIKS
jgi:hypothetical protein